jgi:hypothetical protein
MVEVYMLSSRSQHPLTDGRWPKKTLYTCAQTNPGVCWRPVMGLYEKPRRCRTKTEHARPVASACRESARRWCRSTGADSDGHVRSSERVRF